MKTVGCKYTKIVFGNQLHQSCFKNQISETRSFSSVRDVDGIVICNTGF